MRQWGLLKSLKEIGFDNLLGIDPSEQCNKNVHDQGIRCIKGDIFSDSFLNCSEKFDCIILTHVLEHILDLSVAIDNICSKLKEGGLLFLEMPDASRYSDFYIVPYYFIDCEHINHFDSNSISNLIKPRGLVEIESKAFSFRVSQTYNYPAVYSIFKKTDSDINSPIIRSEQTKLSFLKFLEQSKIHDSNNQIINQLVSSQEPVIIWGAGQFSLRLLANTKLKECNIKGFIDSDSNKQGKEIIDFTINSPEFIEYNATFSIVICSALFSNEIEDRIRTLNEHAKIYSLR